jgi:hypothetical protein
MRDTLDRVPTDQVTTARTGIRRIIGTMKHFATSSRAGRALAVSGAAGAIVMTGATVPAQATTYYHVTDHLNYARLGGDAHIAVRVNYHSRVGGFAVDSVKVYGYPCGDFEKSGWAVAANKITVFRGSGLTTVDMTANLTTTYARGCVITWYPPGTTYVSRSGSVLVKVSGRINRGRDADHDTIWVAL